MHPHGVSFDANRHQWTKNQDGTPANLGKRMVNRVSEPVIP